MEKKTIGTTIATILTILFIMTIGASFATFRVEKLKIEVKAITISADENIIITDQENNSLYELDVKSNEIGVRPSTGRQDAITNIPSTINDTINTEGAYATFYLTSSTPYVLYLESATVSCGQDENLDNIFIGVMDDKSEAISINEKDKPLLEGGAADKQKIIIVAWLDGDATDSLAGADISFYLRVSEKV